MSSKSNLLLLSIAVTTLSCADRPSKTASSLTHLADALSSAQIVSAPAPMAARDLRRWSFHEDLAGWTSLSSDQVPRLAAVAISREQESVRLRLGPPESVRGVLWIGGLQTELEAGLRLDDWESVVVQARSRDKFAGITVSYNVDEQDSLSNDMAFFFSTGDVPPVFNDGSTQRYAIPLRRRDGDESPDLRSLAVVFASPQEAAVDVLSIELVPKGADYLDDYGTASVVRNGETRDTVFVHAPSTIDYSVGTEPASRLDVAFAVEPGSEVTYRVVSETAGRETEIFSEVIRDSATWHQRSIDLSAAAPDQKIRLETLSNREGAVGFWGAPIVSHASASAKPNVIFYVIDGGDANFMSLYGYDRQTTPFLNSLASEAVVFDRAYANSTWTQPSTASFMTSLQHSVLGGLRRGVHSTPVPTNAVTMAEHFRSFDYQTASFSANPNTGRIIGLQQGVDVMRDGQVTNHSTSSIELHKAYSDFRRDYPGSPSWVHFQTADVHEPNHPEPPFAGTFVEEGGPQQLQQWDFAMFSRAFARFGRTSVTDFYDYAMDLADVPRQEYFEIRRGLYDETMMHQDHQLEELVAQLKERGEWENTILVIGSDHGHPAGTFARFGRGLLDPQPEGWQNALFDAYATRIPLIFVWPQGIKGGQRIDQPVSMIDVLPTLLDLIGAPEPKILQGRSLAPILRGEEMEARPVILDEFRIDDETGEFIGNLEIIDGKWGASLEIGSVGEDSDPERGRHEAPVGGRWGSVHPYFKEAPSLLLFDLEKDPYATQPLNDDYPELVEKYRALLLEQWEAHQSLALQFGAADDVTLSPEQLQQLKSLGYIQ